MVVKSAFLILSILGLIWAPVHSSLAKSPAQISPATAVVDTVDLYGGPGSLLGKFQTEYGDPEPQGWTTSDGSAPKPDIWNVSTYQAANLTPETPGNQAWWCGEMFPACGDDEEGGYGNNWESILGWQGTVLDPALPAQVTVTGILNHDSEVGYDYLTLEFMTYGGVVNQALALDGKGVGLEFSESFTYESGEYLTQYGDFQVQFAFRSDGGWSDEDCIWPTVGAAQIDNLQVIITQEGAPDVISPVETCEPGEPLQWGNVPNPGYGNYAQLWMDLDDEDPEVDNFTPQWAFIDDGIIQPGTGGTTCNQGEGCYGPDSLVVNIYGGLHNQIIPGLKNHITSPVIELPITTGLPDMPNLQLGELVFSADIYMHSDDACGPLIVVGFDLLSTADPLGETGWESSDEAILTYWADPAYERVERVFNRESLVPDALLVKMQLTAMDIRTIYCWTWLFSTPAPYIDNVRLQAGMVPGPASIPDVAAASRVKVYPNPFNPKALISFNTRTDQQVKVAVYDIRGRLVRELANRAYAAGPQTLEWQGRDDKGRAVPSGAYYFRVEMGDEVITKKAMLVR